jgi:hypothetical protein
MGSSLRHVSASRQTLVLSSALGWGKTTKVVRALATKALHDAQNERVQARKAKATKQSEPAPVPATVDEVASKRDANDNCAAVKAGDTTADFDAALAYAQRTKKRTPRRR